MNGKVIENKDENDISRYVVSYSIFDEDFGDVPGWAYSSETGTKMDKLKKLYNTNQTKLYGFKYKVGDIMGVQISFGAEFFPLAGASFNFDYTMVGVTTAFGSTIGGGLGLSAGGGTTATLIVCTKPGRYNAESIQNGQGFKFELTLGALSYGLSGNYSEGEGKDFRIEGSNYNGTSGTLSSTPKGLDKYFVSLFKAINAAKPKATLKYEWTKSTSY